MSLAAAPLIAALILVLLGFSLRAPALQDVRRRKTRRRGAGDRGVLYRREAESGRVDLRAVAEPGYAAAHRASSRRPDTGKRALDIAAACALLIALAPLLLLVAAAVKLDSAGPVLYRQRRIGRDGRVFAMFKFRSMTDDAERAGPQWAAPEDARVTRVGRLLRKTRFDEVPQAINVLRGEMSLVGPRPERPEFVALLEKEIPNYHLRHAVKPGITGWAQVKFTYGASVEDARIKLQYDLFYIGRYSLRLDLIIMLMTVRVMLFGLGSR